MSRSVILWGPTGNFGAAKIVHGPSVEPQAAAAPRAEANGVSKLTAVRSATSFLAARVDTVGVLIALPGGFAGWAPTPVPFASRPLPTLPGRTLVGMARIEDRPGTDPRDKRDDGVVLDLERLEAQAEELDLHRFGEHVKKVRGEHGRYLTLRAGDSLAIQAAGDGSAESLREALAEEKDA